MRSGTTLRSFALLTGLFVLAGCRSADGIYLPDCVAYAGDTIELHGGRFEWDKFTDQVIVRNDAVVDQFPDYPVAGSYVVDADTVSFTADNGMALPDMHLASVGERVFLITSEQFSVFRNSNEIASCALVLGGHEKP